MSRFFFTYCLVFLLSTSCSSQNILELEERINFIDQSIFSCDKDFVLYQLVSTKDSTFSYEEFHYDIKFTFLDIDEAKAKRTLNTELDSEIFQCEFRVFFVSDFMNPKKSVDGNIEIIHCSNDEITLRMNLIV